MSMSPSRGLPKLAVHVIVAVSPSVTVLGSIVMTGLAGNKHSLLQVRDGTCDVIILKISSTYDVILAELRVPSDVRV